MSSGITDSITSQGVIRTADIAAGMVSGAYHMWNKSASPGKRGFESTLISMASRYLDTMQLVKMRAEGTDRSFYSQQVYVALLSAMAAYMNGASPMNRVVQNVSSDFGSEIAMQLLGVQDTTLFAGGGGSV